MLNHWFNTWQDRCHQRRLRRPRHLAQQPMFPCAAQILEVRALLSQVGLVTVGPQVGSLTYGTAGDATFLVTVDRGSSIGAFTADLSLTTTLPAGGPFSFNPSRAN